MRVAVLVTGGKDSTLALHLVLKKEFEVKCLASMIPIREDSWMFHYPNICLVDMFAEAVDIPLVKSETSGVKEEEVEDLKSLIAGLDVEGVVSGAIASNYQRSRIDRVCRELGLESIVPLWNENELDMLETIVDLGFVVIITGVYAYGFDQKWLGRKITTETIEDLQELNRRYGISLAGEGGEYETLVVDAPFFKKRIRPVKAEVLWKDQYGHLLITEAEVEDK